MRPHTSPRTWVFSLFLMIMFSAVLTQPPLAAGHEPTIPPQPDLAPEIRSRLAEAARDSRLEPWQREFMLGVARGTTGDAGLAPPYAAIASIDGDWTEVRPPAGRSWPSSIYDPVRDRMVVFGGYDGSYYNDVWSLSLAGTPAWSKLSPAGIPPSGRNSQTAVYDPVRDRMVVFGGANPSNLYNDVWAMSLAGIPTWSQLSPAGSPPAARQGHTALYDPVRDRMLVFGGYDGSYYNDVWSLSFAGSPAWGQLAPTGTAPVGRYAHTTIYDPSRDRVVVFGGISPSGVPLNDVWTLSLAGSPAWSEMLPAGTAPLRYGHVAIYDAPRDRMVFFGGADSFIAHNDLWALSFAGSPTWTEITPIGAAPVARYFHTAIYDPVRDRMVAFGGFDGTNYRSDVWALSLAGSPAWSDLTSASPPPSARESHTAIYDPVRQRMLMFGGFDGTFSRNDVWALSLAGSPAWSDLFPAGISPSARSYHSAIYDPLRDRMLVFGGADGSGLRNDVWALALSGSPTWSELFPAGISPSARYLHTAIYDPVRDRMLVFGGDDGGSGRNDVWALALSGGPAWSELAPAGGPPSARESHTAIYDPVRDRMVVFGGYFGGVPFNDAWALSLAGGPAWSALAAAGTAPAARSTHTAIYDPVRDRMVVFAGIAPGSGSVYRNDAWALSLAGSPAWSALAPAGTSPLGRTMHSAIYDRERDRMVVFGGQIANYPYLLNDLWVLSWHALAEVTNLRWCTGSKNCLQWTAVGNATEYRLYRGERASVPCVANPALDSCADGVVATNTTGETVVETPAAGRFFWFLVTAADGAGEGSTGTATSGPRQVNITGACSPSCAAAGAGCSIDGDCCSSLCSAGTCAAACCKPNLTTCTTASDCCSQVCSGGTCQSACVGSQDCPGTDSQCRVRTCTGGMCGLGDAPIDSACTQGGGNYCDGAGTCVECTHNSQCGSMVCASGSHTCVPPSCSDGVENGTETDVDCGGTCPTGCASGQGCVAHTDCATGACNPTTMTCSVTCGQPQAPGANCASYCDCMTDNCPTKFASHAACIDACAVFDGAAICCRAQACQAAIFDPIVHCPHAAGESVCP